MNSPNEFTLPSITAGADAPINKETRAGTEANSPISESDLNVVLDVPITVTAILGTKRMPIAEIARLEVGSVLQLERQVGEPIDILVDGRLIARGEVVLADERLAITMTDVVKSEK